MSPLAQAPGAGAPTVLLAGHVTLDRHGSGFVPGGAATYCALAYAGLGARVRVLSAAGPEFPAGALGRAEVAFAPAPRTTTFANAYGPDGLRSQRVLAAAPPLDPARLPPAWRAADLLHLAPILAEVELAAFRRAVQARFSGLGVQGWVRRLEPDGSVSQPRWDPAPEELAGIDAAVLGEDDVPGQGDLVGRLARHVPVVAFTHGRRGCEVIARGRTWRVGVHPAREVDPTGAGDVFSAGFFLALAGGAEPADAARLGAAAASICVEGVGPSALGRIGEARARAAAVPAQLAP
ncbi:PfkB family carbohydrate kinase [Anaeromyxobacter diazotrophicus]|uniref:Ribokinase n=1 Tax=Anaeromyxobacter diazotrophicus TaxID=2590199 RepID=A0A7I9VS23_9BACT|nr:PfkB family carbohydrate kinase [Anaeromyxobacter diazotrophicus]GEJ59233.1 ribokinase [Anaeromyxobacter diazotrophicus]